MSTLHAVLQGIAILALACVAMFVLIVVCTGGVSQEEWDENDGK